MRVLVMAIVAVTMVANSASAITGKATTNGATPEEMLENLRVHVMAEEGATLDLKEHPVVVGEHAVYVVMITERDAKSSGETYEEQPLLVPLPKDDVRVEGDTLTVTRPVDTIGYCLSPGSAVPGWNGPESLVVPTWEGLSSKLAIAMKPDKIEQVLATGVCEPEWVKYVRITPTTVRRAVRILDSNVEWTRYFSCSTQDLGCAVAH
ncbi:hypothetical protein [Methanopyrus kandleri]